MIPVCTRSVTTVDTHPEASQNTRVGYWVLVALRARKRIPRLVRGVRRQGRAGEALQEARFTRFGFTRFNKYYVEFGPCFKGNVSMFGSMGFRSVLRRFAGTYVHGQHPLAAWQLLQPRDMYCQEGALSVGTGPALQNKRSRPQIALIPTFRAH